MHAATGTKKNATKQEDETLIRMVEIHGERRWNKVAEGVAGRNGKGCSHRCVLRALPWRRRQKKKKNEA